MSHLKREFEGDIRTVEARTRAAQIVPTEASEVNSERVQFIKQLLQELIPIELEQVRDYLETIRH